MYYGGRMKIKTNSNEIYRKFNSLNFTDEIVLRGFDKKAMKQLVDEINKNDKNVGIEFLDNNITVIKKLKHIRFEVIKEGDKK